MSLGFEHKDARLLMNFVGMTVRDKYLGSSLGSVWGIANPLLMLSVFVFVFGFVFKVRLPGADTTLAYAIWLISGYGPWIATSEATMAATTSVVSAAGIVKNVAFKAELLPIAGALTGLLPLTVALSFLALLLLADGNVPTWHALLLPIVIALHFALIIGFGLCLAAFNVFFRDLAYALPNLLMIALFATPIFYPIESMPAAIQEISRWNPFYVLVEAYRALLVGHKIPELLPLVFVAGISVALLYGSLSVFRRLKGYFEAAL